VTAELVEEVLGEPPVPEGSWAGQARYLSAAALRRRVPPGELAVRLRALPGVALVEIRDDGVLSFVVRRPGEVVEQVLAAGGPVAGPAWPDLPRTWDNPGFVVRYAAARAEAVRRWAGELGVPEEPFLPEALEDPLDRAVLRVLAELPGRRAAREPGWEPYLRRLALAYHDAHERAPAVPVGDRRATPVHTARVRLARAVRLVLPGPDRL
jgi:hypothetical protein